MKAGEVVEPAFKAYLLYADLVFDQVPAGLPYPDIVDELRIGFPGPRLKITTKRMRAHIGNGSNLFGSYWPAEIGERVFIDRVDALIFVLLKIVVKADGCQQLIIALSNF